MRKVESELEEFGKSALKPLRQEPRIDANIFEEEKARFLLSAENIRKNIIPHPAKAQTAQASTPMGKSMVKPAFPVFKAILIAALLIVMISVSSFTAYAAQSSLPGETLYPIKSTIEDIRLSITVSPKAKLDLTLDYTNRRMGEIRSLVASGKILPAQTSDRYQQELDDALQLAAQLNDQQIQAALLMIKSQAQTQGMTVDELIASLPDQASPAIIHLRARLQEQVTLSSLGEKNPKEFRQEMQEWAHNRHGPKQKPTSDESEFSPLYGSLTPDAQDGSGGKIDGTAVPTHGNQGNGQWQSTPGNGNHGQNPTHTPQP